MTMQSRNIGAAALLIGAALGAGACMWASSDQGSRIKERFSAWRREREEQRLTERMATMIDEVAHRDDIPETPIKQAFEEAVHERKRH